MVVVECMDVEWVGMGRRANEGLELVSGSGGGSGRDERNDSRGRNAEH